MRLTVISGDRQVHISVKGDSAKTLRAAERMVRRLLADGPDEKPKAPFGFTATVTASDRDPE
jgi:hypothetical protein